MDDGVFPPDTTLGTLPDTTTVDFEFMDELLFGGCWLETMDGSDFLQPSPSTSNAFFNSSHYLPSSDINNGRLNPNPPENSIETSIIPKHTYVEPQAENSAETQSLNSNKDKIAEYYEARRSSELSRRRWIGPKENSGPSVRERLIQAIKYIRDTIKNGDVLIQIWLPVQKGDKLVLVTNDQPFSLDYNCHQLTNYRNVSIKYQFPADEDSHEPFGLPGRVYLEKVPEWTPNVQFFSSDEYPRVNDAQRYNVRGTLALPIFERDTRSCLGVLEVVMTTPKINYHLELENVCKALEAVDLRSSEVSSTPYVKACNESYQAAPQEILEVLRSVCETHRLPLAQTWVPCIQQGKEGCRHSEENYAYCVSTMDSACYVADPYMLGFHKACSEHHLFRGQGVAGRAFMTNQPCFSTDITALSKKDYPLLHYAKMFGLCASVAIRLRSIYAEASDYVLEFFLPVDCRDIEEQTMMLNSLSVIFQQVCNILRVITDKELEEETSLRIGEVLVSPEEGPNREESLMLGSVPSNGSFKEESSWIADMVEAQRKGKSVRNEATEGFRVTTHWDNPDVVLLQQEPTFPPKQHHQDSHPKDNIECGGGSSFRDRSFSSGAKTVEKRRTKTEKTISLQVLRQYFSGSLKDAAKSIGVCPTTLKRICRQHGITRWPSRKIKKVGHSLRKLQVVIDSVQGAEGSFQIGSFYANFPELTSPNLPGSSPFSTMKWNDHLKSLNTKPEGVYSPQTVVLKSPSSSCSPSSSSSLCCSSGIQKHPHIANLACNEDASMLENPGVLKRACSDAELLTSCQEEPRLLARSQSHKFLNEHPSLESLPPLPKSSSYVSRDKGAIRVKATYGEEKVRFSMQLDWGFVDLQQEIAKRFHIDDMSRIDLKYLDDDSEWVLLTCDADLEECVDVYKSLRTHTIKLSIHQVSHPKLGRSFGTSGPS